MHEIGALRVSHEIAVAQKDLVSWLERKAMDPTRTREIRRQERVIGRIIELKSETAAWAVKIVLPDALAPSTDLPAGVSVQPGLLMIAFTTEEQLLERLFLLARLFAANPQILNSLPEP